MKEETGDGLYSRQNAQEGEISHRQLSGRISRCELKSGVARGSGRERVRLQLSHGDIGLRDF
jgi:hypothetical protein